MDVSYGASSVSGTTSWTPNDRHPIALWAAPCKMNDLGKDRDDQEHVNQACLRQNRVRLAGRGSVGDRRAQHA
jgi:hypothetical protein